jgi:putative ABC transport system permease protein
MESLLQDLRFGFRILVKSPGITISVIVALMLGIGANAAMFSVVDALLLHPLRYEDPGALAVVWDRDAQGTIRNASAANYLDWREQAKSFSDLAAWRGGSYVITGGDRPEQILGASVTANFFRTLGVKPILGRTFLPDEDGIRNNTSPSKVAVIGARFWRENLGADANVLGRRISLNGVPYAIIGVAPQGFQFISRQHQIWVPLSLDRQNRDYHYLAVVGRLRAKREAAAAEMATLARSLDQAYPKTNKGWGVQVDDLLEWLINRSFRTRLLLLFGAVGLVLLIACTNIASLLLARSAVRNREVAVRISLGATRARVTRQLLTESVLLAFAGGAAGVGLAWWLIRMAPGVVPANTLPTTAPIELNRLVVLFSVAITALTGILFGIAPALAATRSDIQTSLKDSSRGSTGGRAKQRFRQVMVAAEVAVALMLLASAGLMIESLGKMNQVDLGFDPKHLLTLRLFLPAVKYDSAKALRFHRQALERIAALPGVRAATLASNLPAERAITMEVPFDLVNSVPRSQGERDGVGYVSVSPEYVKTLEIPLRRGREFTQSDNSTAPPVVIVNEAFASRYFPNEDAVGKRILLNRPKLGSNAFDETIQPEIVGVIGNVKKLEDLFGSADPILFVPHAQNVWSPIAYFVLRIEPTASLAALTSAIRRELTEMDKDQPIDQLGSFDQIVSNRLAEPRFQTQLMGAFALVALLLAIVGIYGVNTYAVMQRRNEIGLRMALGATPMQVLTEILKQGMLLTTIGIAIGLAGAIAIASLLKSVVVGVSATDPVTLGGVSILLAAVAALACYVPARRATYIDPAIALRQE